MATQVQFRGGTTAEHSTFTGASREVTVDTDKETLVVHDGSTAGGFPVLRQDGSNSAFALGSAASPSLKWDANTGIYSPGADQLALSTNGTQRLSIDTDGTIMLGSPDSSTAGVEIGRGATGNRAVYLDLIGDTTYTDYAFRILRGSEGANANSVLYHRGTGTLGFNAQDAGNIAFYTSDNERLRITSDGKLGLGTSSPQGLFSLTSAGTSTQLTVQTVAGANDIIKFDTYNASAVKGIYAWYQEGSEVMRLDASGKLGIGTASPDYKLDILPDSAGAALRVRGGSGAVGLIQFTDDIASAQWGTLSATSGSLDVDHSSVVRFYTSSSERARIDSSGRLLVGASTSASGGQAQYARLQVEGNTFGVGQGIVAIRRASSSSGLTAGTPIGQIDFTDNAGEPYARIEAVADGSTGTNDYPSRLVFFTTADGASVPTERMRIKSTGSSAFLSTATVITPSTTTSAGTTNAFIYARHSATTVDDGTNSFTVWSNGNVENTNNSYTGISDVKLKENIVSASSQWDDIKALRPVNYNFKPETGQQTHTQIGLIAQEVELVSPGLVGESPDRDAEGNDLGTVTKSVNYSVLYMKAVKALQEAMERIETLEAKVAALESA